MTSTSRGLDVSAYQAAQNWTALKADGLTFGFAKATEGQQSRDPKFATHIKGIKGAGLIAGAYHFAWPNQSAAVEAANYVAAVKPYAGAGFLHWLDLERYSDGRNYKGRSAAQIKAYAAAWIAAVKKAFPGQIVGIYTSASDIASGHVPSGVPLWYPAYPWGAATYTRAEAATRPKPSGRTVTFWQFTSTPLDRNIAYLSPTALREWAQGDSDDSDDSDDEPTYTPPKFPTGLAPGKAAPSAATLQHALKSVGYMAKSVKESPNYGPATQAAVAKFHNAHPTYRAKGTTHDVKIGPKGWAALFRLAYGK